MFAIGSGQPSKAYCDGYSRRNFLRVGALGVGGVMLGDLLRAEAAAARGHGDAARVMHLMALKDAL